MKCFLADVSPDVDPMMPLVKSSLVRHYRNRLFRTQWPFVLANLYADSTLVWFDGVEVLKANPRGYVELSKVSKMIALGKATNQLRNKPILPNGVDSSNLLAIGHENTITWLLFYSSSETCSWMSAILEVIKNNQPKEEGSISWGVEPFPFVTDAPWEGVGLGLGWSAADQWDPEMSPHSLTPSTLPENSDKSDSEEEDCRQCTTDAVDVGISGGAD